MKIYYFSRPLAGIEIASQLDRRARHAGILIDDPEQGLVEISVTGSVSPTPMQLEFKPVDVFRRQTRSTKGRWAYEVGDTQLSFSELQTKAKQWANEHPFYTFYEDNCRSFVNDFLHDLTKSEKLNLHPSISRNQFLNHNPINTIDSLIKTEGFNVDRLIRSQYTLLKGKNDVQYYIAPQFPEVTPTNILYQQLQKLVAEKIYPSICKTVKGATHIFIETMGAPLDVLGDAFNAIPPYFRNVSNWDNHDLFNFLNSSYTADKGYVYIPDPSGEQSVIRVRLETKSQRNEFEKFMQSGGIQSSNQILSYQPVHLTNSNTGQFIRGWVKSATEVCLLSRLGISSQVTGYLIPFATTQGNIHERVSNSVISGTTGLVLGKLMSPMMKIDRELNHYAAGYIIIDRARVAGALKNGIRYTLKKESVKQITKFISEVISFDEDSVLSFDIRYLELFVNDLNAIWQNNSNNEMHFPYNPQTRCFASNYLLPNCSVKNTAVGSSLQGTPPVATFPLSADKQPKTLSIKENNIKLPPPQIPKPEISKWLGAITITGSAGGTWVASLKLGLSYGSLGIGIAFLGVMEGINHLIRGHARRVQRRAEKAHKNVIADVDTVNDLMKKAREKLQEFMNEKDESRRSELYNQAWKATEDAKSMTQSKIKTNADRINEKKSKYKKISQEAINEVFKPSLNDIENYKDYLIIHKSSIETLQQRYSIECDTDKKEYIAEVLEEKLIASAKSAFDEGKYQIAVNVFDQVINKDKHNWNAILGKIIAEARLGKKYTFQLFLEIDSCRKQLSEVGDKDTRESLKNNLDTIEECLKEQFRQNANVALFAANQAVELGLNLGTLLYKSQLKKRCNAHRSLPPPDMSEIKPITQALWNNSLFKKSSDFSATPKKVIRLPKQLESNENSPKSKIKKFTI